MICNLPVVKKHTCVVLGLATERVTFATWCSVVVAAVLGGCQTRAQVIVPIISDTTKRSFHQSSHGGSTAARDQHDTTRPLSAVIRSVFHIACTLIVLQCFDAVGWASLVGI